MSFLNSLLIKLPVTLCCISADAKCLPLSVYTCTEWVSEVCPTVHKKNNDTRNKIIYEIFIVNLRILSTVLCGICTGQGQCSALHLYKTLFPGTECPNNS